MDNDALPPLHDLGPALRRPQLALVNPRWKDNINAQFVLARLASFLQTLVSGETPRGQLKHRVLIAPCPSPDNLDEIAQMTRSAYYRIELTTGGNGMDALPQIALHAPNDDERATACLFGLPAVIEHGADVSSQSAGMPPWLRAPGEYFLLQAGRTSELQPALCERLFHSLVNFLIHTGIVGDLALAEVEDDFHYFNAGDEFVLLGETNGMFVSRHEPGRWLQAGDLVGHIYNRHSGALSTDVCAPIGGLLTAIRREPLVDEDTPLAIIQKKAGPRGPAKQEE